nr:hypothetical protein CFP56_67386 [Quercus suber]
MGAQAGNSDGGGNNEDSHVHRLHFLWQCSGLIVNLRIREPRTPDISQLCGVRARECFNCGRGIHIAVLDFWRLDAESQAISVHHQIWTGKHGAGGMRRNVPRPPNRCMVKRAHTMRSRSIITKSFPPASYRPPVHPWVLIDRTGYRVTSPETQRCNPA